METMMTHQLTISPLYIRGSIDSAHADRMHDAIIRAGNKWPPTMPPVDIAPLLDTDPAHVKLIKQGFTHEILDGAHRYTGSRTAGLQEVPVNLMDIPADERIVHQVTANAGHSALPFSREARDRAIQIFKKVKKWSNEKIGQVMKMHASSISRIYRGIQDTVLSGKKGRAKKAKKRTGSVEFAKWLADGLAFCKAGASIKGFLAKVETGASQLQTLVEGLEAFVE